MKTAKQFLVVSAAFIVAVVTFSVVAPKAAHAVIATLVQVTNTASNPVPADIDNSARHVVRLKLNGNGTTFNAALLDSSNSQPFVVPAGKRFVLEQVTLFSNQAVGQLAESYIFADGWITLPIVDQLPGQGVASILTRGYVDAGHGVEFYIQGTGPSLNWTVAANGYLIDCNGVC
jgi:hypothetical protein